MVATPSQTEQIRQAHAALIVQIVRCCQNPELKQETDAMLDVALANGWTELVRVVRLVLSGQREESLLQDLDDEDRVIVEAILQGLQDPATLPDPNKQADPAHAAPGLAGMIHAAARGEVKALEVLGNMAAQMQQAGGEMARVGAVLRRLVNGERDARKLTKGMGAMGRQLVESILEELGKLGMH